MSVNWDALLAIAEWVTLGGGLLAYVISLERRLAARMTYAHHNKECAANQAELKSDLAEIKEMMRDSAEKRLQLAEKVDKIGTKVAVIADRVGLNIGDSGRFQT